MPRSKREEVNFEEDARINEQALDVEWLDHPRKVVKYAKIVAEARREADRAKDYLEVVKAELDKDIRTNPEKYEITKITEGVVTNTILLQKECQDASEAFIEAKYHQSLAIEALRAISDRKDALENLVKLLGAQYFSGPTAPREISKEWEKEQKRKNANASVKISKRREKE